MKQTGNPKHPKTLSRMYRNSLISILILIFCCCAAVTYWSYVYEKNQILTKTDILLNNVLIEFQGIEENFWSVYMPIFEISDTYDVMYKYFTANTGVDITPMEKRDVAKVTKQIASRNSKISWVAFFSPLREKNYIYYVTGDILEEMPQNFPFYSNLLKKKDQMETYGARVIPDHLSSQLTFALCGGVPGEMGKGSVLVGYESSMFDQLLTDSTGGARYTVLSADDVIYDSSKEYTVPQMKEEHSVNSESGHWVYTRTIVQAGKGYTVSYHLQWWSLFTKANRNTPIIIGIGTALALVALFSYFLFTTSVFRQVEKIKAGLQKLGDNNLDFRLSEEQNFGEFESISHSINQMAVKLQVLIENEYLYCLREKEAQLAELQSKFDPHFLYNSLEVIRGRVYETGDIKTANVIKKLSQIFRSLIGEKRFVTIQDELAFCSSYFSLIQSSSCGDNLQLIYDVESSLLLCGIIRNLLQPLIENYFVHGFDIHSQENRITIRCHESEDGHICIQIIDNGLGISSYRLKELTDEMEDNNDNPERSYGLKNLSRRIQIFYGKDCGIELNNNPDKGVCVTVRIKKMTCEQHENHFRANIHHTTL